MLKRMREEGKAEGNKEAVGAGRGMDEDGEGVSEAEQGSAE